MNIFYLDSDIRKNAMYHCDKHVVKMILEQTQLLFSAYYSTGEVPDGAYKLTHKNHPCAIWARESRDNWLWLRDMTLALCEEYTFRYGKNHKCEDLVRAMQTPSLASLGITKRPQAMPLEFKELDCVKAYRNYYIAEKADLLTYTLRSLPEWVAR